MARIVLCGLMLLCHRCCMAGYHMEVGSCGGSFFQKSAKVSLSAAAVGNGGEPKLQSSPTHPPTNHPRRQASPQALRGGYSEALIIYTKAAHCTARTFGGTPHRIARRCCWDVPHAIWPGRRGGLLGGRRGCLLAGCFGCLGFGCTQAACVRAWLGHCHLLNLRSERAQRVTSAQLKLRRLCFPAVTTTQPKFSRRSGKSFTYRTVSLESR